MRDGLIATFLGVVTALSRLPFIANRLWEWDSVLYARALEHGFHVDDVLPGSRPHPPGYIFYVASAAVAKAFGLDSDHALVAVSVVASGVAVAALYLLCRRFGSRWLAILFSTSFAASPLVWLHGDVAMPYILLATLTTVLVLAFRLARGGSARRVVATSVLFGSLAGFRQDLILFLLPLWLWMLVPASGRTRLIALGAMGAGCLLWFVPSAYLSDGPGQYVLRSVRQLAGLSGTSANLERSIAVNAVLVGYSLAWALLILLVVLVVLGLARALAAARGLRRTTGGEGLFFGLWLVPPLVFDLFVHIGEWGFVLSLVPGLYVMLVWIVEPLAGRASRALRVGGAALIGANALAGALLFIVGTDPVFSAASLAAHDRATDAKAAYINGRLVPGEPVVVVAAAEALVAAYYLPGHTVWYSARAAATSHERRVDRLTTIVVYEPAARPLGDAPLTHVDLGSGIGLDLLPAGSGAVQLGGTELETGLQ
jgi:4-amino-4-deoxy-L-arabinose transferase-like glycosyltransferase